MAEGKRLSDEVQRISAEAAEEAAARSKVSNRCCPAVYVLWRTIDSERVLFLVMLAG